MKFVISHHQRAKENSFRETLLRQALREALSEAQRHRCAYCCCDIREGVTLEHIKPVCRGGRTSYENCVVACLKCNHERGHLCEWRQYKRVKAIRRQNKLGGTLKVAA